MRIRLARGLSALALILAFALGACDLGHDNILDPEHEGTLSIEGPTVLEVGERVGFRVTSSTSGVADLPFVWTSSPSTRLRFNLGGIATAVSPGPVNIQARYFDIVINQTVTVE